MRQLFVFCCALFLLAGPVAAEKLEVLSLRHRPAEQVIPLLQPLLKQDEAITGTGFQLIVRAPAASIEKIRTLLAEFDRPLQQLKVVVRMDGASERNQQQLNTQTQIEVGRRVQIRGQIQINSTQETQRNQNTQSIQVLEGGTARISSGIALPFQVASVILRPGVIVLVRGQQYIDVSSGLSVRPILRGDQVWLELQPHIQNIQDNAQGRTLQTTQLNTTVQVPLGEWLQLSEMTRDDKQQRDGILTHADADGRQSRSIWLRVERVQN